MPFILGSFNIKNTDVSLVNVDISSTGIDRAEDISGLIKKIIDRGNGDNPHALLTGALQEAVTRIETLEAQVSALITENNVKINLCH